MSATPPYSPANPPTAPRKKKLALRRGLQVTPLRLSFDEKGRERTVDVEAEKMNDWRILVDSGRVREKFLHYNPEDITVIDDLYHLDQLRSWYMPSLQPQDFLENAYLQLMSKAINDRLASLISLP